MMTSLVLFVRKKSRLLGASVYNGNSRFQLPVRAESYPTYPVDSSSDHRGLFWVALRLGRPFTARSQASSGYRFILPPFRSKLYPNLALSGQITC